MREELRTVNRLIQIFNGLKPLKLEYQQKLDEKFRLDFNFNSNHLEGNTLTYGETKLLLIFGQTDGKHELREYEEMKSHDVAYQIIKDWVREDDRPLSEQAIKNLHEVLLVRPFWKDAITHDGQNTKKLIEIGNYKKLPNNVRLQSGEIYNYPTPEETPILMGELIDWFRAEEQKKEIPPVVLAAMLHYKFVAIHPFDDGNGRIARLLMNYVLLKNDLPMTVVKSDDKKDYLFALNQADSGNLDVFVEYIIQQVIHSLNMCIRAAKGESIEEKGDLEKKISLLKRKLGEDPYASIQIYFGDEALEKVILNSVIPLSRAWEAKLKQFDTLIISREVGFFSEAKSFKHKHFGDAFDKNCNDFINNKPVSRNKFNKFSVQCQPRGLRNINNNISFNGGEFSIELLPTSYELTYTNSNRPVNKLYHQALSKNEIEMIADHLGNFFLKVVEQIIETEK